MSIFECVYTVTLTSVLQSQGHILFSIPDHSHIIGVNSLLHQR